MSEGIKIPMNEKIRIPINEEMRVLNEILDARENRAGKQRELIDKYKTTLVSFTLNIPGARKSDSSFTIAHEAGISLLEDELRKNNIKLVNKEVRVTAAGDEAFLNVDADETFVKKITVTIEDEHKLGRLFDFDVFSNCGEQINRAILGLPQRKCLLCKENAKVCARSGRHSINELLDKIYKLIKEDYLQ